MSLIDKYLLEKEGKDYRYAFVRILDELCQKGFNYPYESQPFEKRVSFFVVVIMCIVLIIAGISGIISPTTTSGNYFSGLSHTGLGLLGIVSIIHYFSKRDITLLRVYILYPALFYPWLRWFSNSCRAINYYHSDSFCFTVPALCTFCVTGGSLTQGIIAVATHILFAIIMLILEALEVPCVWKEDRTPHLSEASVVAIILPLLVVYFTYARFISTIALHREQLQKDIETAAQLAARIVHFDLEGLEHPNPEKASDIEILMYEIVSNLKRYRPFLPDYVFEHSETVVINIASPNKTVTMDTLPEVIPSVVFNPNTKFIPTPSSNAKFMFPPSPAAYLIEDVISEEATPKNSKNRSSNSIRGIATKSGNPSSQFSNLSYKTITTMYVSLLGVEQATCVLTLPEIEDLQNSFLENCYQSVKENQGTIISQTGHQFIAVWNATRNIASHQAAACQAALVLKNLMTPMPFKDKGIALGIYVTTGRAAIGQLGTNNTRAFCAASPDTSIAPTVASLAGHLGTPILVSDGILKGAEFQFQFRLAEVIKTEGPKIVNLYELEQEIPMSAQVEGEWMYEIHRRRCLSIAMDKFYQAGFQQLLDKEYQESVYSFEKHLQEHPDDHRCRVLLKIAQAYTKGLPLPEPYCRVITPPWSVFSVECL